jgi:hypothetical protein
MARQKVTLVVDPQPSPQKDDDLEVHFRSRGAVGDQVAVLTRVQAISLGKVIRAKYGDAV